jgi:hypothetical protein
MQANEVWWKAEISFLPPLTRSFSSLFLAVVAVALLSFLQSCMSAISVNNIYLNAASDIIVSLIQSS